MKKIKISLLMVIAATTTSFAKSHNTDVANAVKGVAEQMTVSANRYHCSA